MREVSRKFEQIQIRSQPREVLTPPPLAVVAMLGLTRSRGQVNASDNNCDFSLRAPNFSDLSGL